MDFLLFQLYSPMVSWGEIAVGGVRQSSNHPSKSAILGLIAAALGIKRDEEEKQNYLASSLGFAVQVYSGGTVLKDFHTTQVPKKESKVVHYTRRSELLADSDKVGTILSTREYRCDALSVVAVYLKDDFITINEIDAALKAPKFHLYLGRKSAAPSLPLAPKIMNYKTLKEAFGAYQVTFVAPISDNKPDWLQKAFDAYPQKTIFDKTISYYWEEDIYSGFNELHSVDRYDFPLSRKRWQFSSRKEFMAVTDKQEFPNVSK